MHHSLNGIKIQVFLEVEISKNLIGSRVIIYKSNTEPVEEDTLTGKMGSMSLELHVKVEIQTYSLFLLRTGPGK